MRDNIYIMEKLSIKQKRIAKFIQKDIPLQKFPFKTTGKYVALNEKEVLNTVRYFLDHGLIRKFGAILRHQRVGYKNNAMVIWSIPSEQTEETGNIFASFSFISHCYERKPAFAETYNIFTMLHSDGRSISSLIKEMVKATNAKDYLILKSVKEFKKTSPEYF